MCTTCGCGDDGGTRVSRLDGTVERLAPPPEQTQGHPHEHDHRHPDAHGHEHAPAHSHPHPHSPGALAGPPSHTTNSHPPQGSSPNGRTTIALEENLLAKNDLLAARNRGWLEGRGVRALNVMSSPGAGKTTLLVRTIRELAGQLDIGVIEGDQETSLDADRIRSTGRPVIQINTGAGCHLDAAMLQRGLDALDPAPGSTVFIENVGNLVCPALFDLGEAARVVVISVTEGDDKPQKYPHMFLAADLVIINKSDLLPHVEFDVDNCLRQARMLNPGVEVLTLSAATGDGMDGWLDWIRKNPRPGTDPAGTASHGGLRV
jgi:hydrogenase nickel incorporation protein HypB